MRALNVLVALGMLGLAVFEAIHDLQGLAWRGYVAGVVYLGFFHVPLWVVGAAALLVKGGRGWPVTFGALLFMFIHGLGIKLGGDDLGWIFAFGALVLFGIALKARPWDRIERQGSTA